MGSYRPISRIAIVGGGPTGVACAKYLLAEKCFERIDIFEQRGRIGGVWNLSPTARSRRIPIPQKNPRYGSETQAISAGGHDTQYRSNSTLNDSLEFESPLYDYLETNIPKHLMKFSDFPFPDDYPLFPSHEEVLEYLEDYARDVRHLIRFETQVQDVELLDSASSSSQSKWRVTSRYLKTEHVTSETYDAVVVANGHYTVPHVPEIAGVAEWHETYPGTIVHSKAYRKPEDFTGQTVLVIGNSASGLDIAGQIGTHSRKLYLSSRSESIFSQKPNIGRDDIDEVIEFLSADQGNRAVKTRSGRIVEGLDSVVFCTGYFYSFPFLPSLQPPIITDGLRTRGVYKDFIHIEHSELAFPVLNLKIIPFGLAENQAAVIARLWSGRLPFPSKTEMRAWEEKTAQEKGDGKYFHLKRFPEDGAQMNELYEWAASARRVQGLDHDGQGKLGMRWDENQVWMRSKFPDIKAAYTKRGDRRREVKTLEELGFTFEDWMKHADDKDMAMFRNANCESFGRSI